MMCNYCYNIIAALVSRCPKCGQAMWFDPEIKKAIRQHARRTNNDTGRT